MIGIFGSVNVKAATNLSNINLPANLTVAYDLQVTSTLSLFGSNPPIDVTSSKIQFSYNSNNIIYENYFTSGNNSYGYRTDYSGSQQIKKGLTANNLYSSDFYYVYDRHNSYPNKFSQSMQIPYSTDYIVSGSNSTDFSVADTYISYRYLYNVSDVFNIPNLAIPNNTSLAGFCDAIAVIDSTGGSYCHDYNDSLVDFQYNSTGTLPAFLEILEVNMNFARFMDYFVNNPNAGILNNTDFASNQTSPYENFLKYYTLTYYDHASGTGYNYHGTSMEESVSINVYPDMRITTSSGDITLDTACSVLAIPVYQTYVENGVTYTVWSFKLAFLYVGYIPEDYSFSAIKVRSFMKYQFPVNTSKSIYEVFIPEYKYYIFSFSNNFNSITDSIYDFLIDIPIIGVLLGNLFLIIVFINEFLNSMLILFIGFPGWFVSGLKIIIFVLLVRIIFKLVRG